MPTRSIPSPTMRAAVYRGRRSIRVEEVPIPRIGRGEVLVRIESCGVCATDLKKIEYDLLPPPRIYGHEMAGVIRAIGSGVRKWRVGDRVAVFHHIPCGRCFYCQRKEYAQCALYRKTGTTAGFEPAGGGFAQFIRVMPWIVKRGMVRVPAKISFDEACLIEPVNTCLKAVDRLGLRREDLVLIYGQGPIGLMFTQLVKIRGARVLALDLMATRRRLAKKLGATLALDPRSAAFGKKLEAMTRGRGADAAILAVPSEAAFKEALQRIRPGGKVLLFAHTRKGEQIGLDAGAVCVDEKTVFGSYSASIDAQSESAKLIFTRKMKVLPLISHRLPLARAEEAFNLASKPTEKSLKIIVKP